MKFREVRVIIQGVCEHEPNDSYPKILEKMVIINSDEIFGSQLSPQDIVGLNSESVWTQLHDAMKSANVEMDEWEEAQSPYPFTQGYMAREYNKNETENPYDPDDTDYARWNHGWETANDDLAYHEETSFQK